jgi:hypothetical protein
MGIDAYNRIFVTYQALAPGFDNSNQNYRHIHVVSSWDGGMTWNEPVDITSDLLFSISECVYPAMSANVGEKIHILFQEDYDPGIYEWLAEHDQVENYMKHMEFDKDFFVNIEDHKQVIEEMGVSTCYPNPAIHATMLTVRLHNSANTTVLVSNLVGQTVKEMKLNLEAGNNPVHLNVDDLASGVYYITVNANNQKHTQKLVVK